MSRNVTAARAEALATLTKTYELLFMVEYKLSDAEANLLIDIAQGIELLEEKLNDDEEEQVVHERGRESHEKESRQHDELDVAREYEPSEVRV